MKNTVEVAATCFSNYPLTRYQQYIQGIKLSADLIVRPENCLFHFL